MKRTFLDVRQSDATVVETESGETVLVDVDEGRVRGALDDAEIDEIDTVVLTHPDYDHTQGLDQVFEEYEPDRVVGPETDRPYGGIEDLSKETLQDLRENRVDELTDDQLDEIESGTTTIYRKTLEVTRDEGLEYEATSANQTADGYEPHTIELDGDASIDVFSPPPRDSEWGEHLDTVQGDSRTDAHSVVGKVRENGNSHLFTGDATEETEQYLMGDDEGVDRDLPETFDDEQLEAGTMSAAHHGSTKRGENQQEFIETVDPEFANISSGTRYKHPFSESVGNFRQVADGVSWTNVNGTVEATNTANGLSVETSEEESTDPEHIEERVNEEYGRKSDALTPENTPREESTGADVNESEPVSDDVEGESQDDWETESKEEGASEAITEDDLPNQDVSSIQRDGEDAADVDERENKSDKVAVDDTETVGRDSEAADEGENEGIDANDMPNGGEGGDGDDGEDEGEGIDPGATPNGDDVGGDGERDGEGKDATERQDDSVQQSTRSNWW